MKIISKGICAGILIFLTSVNGVYAGGTSKIVKLHVNGMTTATCPVLLKSAVRKINGVRNVQASLENHSATIEFDERLTSLQNIQDTIESSVGFSTELR